VHLSSGGTQSSPIPSNAFFSASTIPKPPCTPSSPSTATTFPVPLSRIPLLSNFQLYLCLTYRLISLWNVVPPDHPHTAQPTVRHGDMMMSTLLCTLGFFAEGFAARSASFV